MTLKNQNIAKANPAAIANDSFINALYKEAYGRDATKAELTKFSGKSVKDASNLILGASNSPFSSTATTATTRPQTTTATTTKTTTAKTLTNRQDIVNNFSKYLNRKPTEAEIAKYSITAPSVLESDLQKQYKTITGKDYKAVVAATPNGAAKVAAPGSPEAEAAAMDSDAEIQKFLDEKLAAGEIDQIKYNALMDIASNSDLTSGQKVYTADELEKLSADALEKATADVQDYYQKTEAEDIIDLRNKYADIRSEGARYKQQEEKSYAEKLATTKANLRARGLTFSGTSRGTLGAETAIKEGAQGIEGSVPQQRRYDVEDKSAQLQEAARDAGLAAERKYGSAWMSSNANKLDPSGLYNPYGGTTTYDANRQQSIYDPAKEGQVGYTKIGSIESTKAEDIEKRRQARLAALTKLTY